MVDSLREVIQALESLPEDQQERIAVRLKELLEEQEWDTFLASEKGNELIDSILANHEKEKQAGTIDDEDW